MSNAYPCVLGISFDGLPISGIVNEFLNIGSILTRRGFRVLFDPGYEVIFRDLSHSPQLLPDWIVPTSVLGRDLPSAYTQEIIEAASDLAIRGTNITTVPELSTLIDQIAHLIFNCLECERVAFLIIENGTLPDNPIFTEALCLAISEYGRDRALGKFVLWRDHDLMWSTEPHFYGRFPYQGVRKPQDSVHIHYAVSTAWMQRRMIAWAPGPIYHIIPNRFLQERPHPEEVPIFRRYYEIPSDAYLIARCTRVMPQKTIQHDLYLVASLREALVKQGDKRDVFLYVTGPVDEDPDEHNKLSLLAKSLSIRDQVIWGNGLLPLNPPPTQVKTKRNIFSIGELLREADLSSFLTSYDYEGFGNPPGEAMAMQLPYIATTYELYHEVYGSRGAIAPLLPIDRTSKIDSLPAHFLNSTMRLLKDEEYRSQVIERNSAVCRRYFSLSALEHQLSDMFPLLLPRRNLNSSKGS